jgi:SAM-dependent methyltransferase/uncharacterized protein YbaR (Trm112 family)
MRRDHFELLRPICPVCRLAGRPPAALGLEVIAHQQDDDVEEGLLRCPDPGCRHEFPILDGVPLIVPQLREYVRGWIERIRGRAPFSEPVESLLGDCCGSGTSFEDERQRLSSYVWDHWADHDPQEAGGATAAPGSILRLLRAGLDAMTATLQPLPDGPAVDLGCSVGRTTFELASRLERPVLGVDLDLSMLRMARQIRDHGEVSYPRRRVGLAYDRRTFAIPPAVLADAANWIDFWCCDATVLPFAEDQFSVVSSLNLLDCTHSPIGHLRELGRCLRHGGSGIVASPYDWSAAATPVEAWLGGHSQRGEGRGMSERLVRDLLTPGTHPATVEGLRIVAEQPDNAWHVRLHERAVMHYSSDLLVVAKDI